MLGGHTIKSDMEYAVRGRMLDALLARKEYQEYNQESNVENHPGRSMDNGRYNVSYY